MKHKTLHLPIFHFCSSLFQVLDAIPEILKSALVGEPKVDGLVGVVNRTPESFSRKNEKILRQSLSSRAVLACSAGWQRYYLRKALSVPFPVLLGTHA